MSALEDLFLSPGHFTGTVRVFPLPNLVMFPHVLQPLHVFEPRYRRLTEDALASDRLIAMAVIEPGACEPRPPLRPVACLGRIATYHRLSDGRFNLLLAGVARVRLVEELDRDTLYRQFRAEPLADVYRHDAAFHRPAVREQLLEIVKSFAGAVPELVEQMGKLASADVPLGLLTDVLAYASDVPYADKIAMLEQPNVDRRARELIRLLNARVPEKLAPADRGFPPAFSLN